MVPSLGSSERFKLPAIFIQVAIEMKEVGKVDVAVNALVTELGFMEWLGTKEYVAIHSEITELLSQYAGPDNIKKLINRVFEGVFTTFIRKNSEI